MQSPAYKRHLENLQNEFDAKKYHELQKLDLYNEKTFYKAFVEDMLNAKKEIVIYSPFVTNFRSDFFSNTLKKLRKRNICVFIFTRPLEEQEYFARTEIKCALRDYEELGVCITYLPGYIHAKVAIIDREILWEGSLNILSQRESKEIMRRIVDEDCTKQIMSYLGLNKPLAEGYKFQYERLCQNLIENSRNNWLYAGLRIIYLGIKALISGLIKLIHARTDNKKLL
jgi:phosphatidylserine/phosphatidylglycerophosphate/cardiolipin synthase-like enzyme